MGLKKKKKKASSSIVGSNVQFRFFVVGVSFTFGGRQYFYPHNCKRENIPLLQLTFPRGLTHLQAGFAFRDCEPIFPVEGQSGPDKVRAE